MLDDIGSRFSTGDYNGMLDLYLDDVLVSAPAVVGKAAGNWKGWRLMENSPDPETAPRPQMP